VMRELRDKTGDAVFVISEADEAVAALHAATEQDAHATVAASSKQVYTADMVFELVPFSESELRLELGDGAFFDQELRQMTAGGRAFMRFIIEKGRDGVMRRNFPLIFHFDECRFELKKDDM